MPSVHPRMRGERVLMAARDVRKNGSSPHARGTHDPLTDAVPFDRFIPACAGNAIGNVPHIFDEPVHPRMRGERARRAGMTRRGDGSSPHARGTPTKSGLKFLRRRFIPACAGNAIPCAQCALPIPVHPRMRGERMYIAAKQGNYPGSSPHARGTPARANAPTIQDRFIPACAGNACRLLPVGPFRSVHPRMRGERKTFVTCHLAFDGSSPHARGTLKNRSRKRNEGRFIPACAGNAVCAAR